MTHVLAKQADILRFLARCKPSVRSAILKTADPSLIRVICEIVDNTLKGCINLSPAQIKRLSRHKGLLRKIAERKGCWKRKKKLIQQSGGFILPLLIPLISGVISKIL